MGDGFTYADCGCRLMNRRLLDDDEGEIVRQKGRLSPGRVYLRQLWMLSEDDFGLSLPMPIVDAV